MEEEDFLAPVTPVTAFERRKAEMEAEAAKPTIGEAIKASVQEDWMMSWALRDREEFAPDPDFYLEKEDYQKAVAGLPEDYHGFVEDAVSPAHLNALREEALQTYENDKKLAQLGWKGVGVRFGVALSDPGAIGLSIATEGVAAPMIWGNKLTRLGRAFRGGTAAATTNALVESYLVSQNAVKDPYDILYSASAGLVLGGGIASLGRVDKTDPINPALLKMAQAADRAQKHEVVTAVNRKIMGEGSEDKFNYPADAQENPFDVQEQVPGRTTDLDEFLDAKSDPAEAAARTIKTPFGEVPVSFDMAGYLLQSKQPTGNLLGRILPEDPVGFRRDANRPLEESADLRKTIEFKVALNEYYGVQNDAYNDWAKTEGFTGVTGYFKRKMNLPRRQFNELVADAIESPELPFHPAVRRAADNQAKVQRDLLRKAQAAGVKGFEEIPEDLTYFTHLWDGFKFVNANARYTEDVVKDLLTRALVNGTEDMNEEAARMIAAAMHKKITDSGMGLDSGAARMFNASQKDVIKEILVEEKFMSVEEADRLMKLFDVKPDGTPARARRRLKFDMKTTISAVNGETGQTETFRLKDLQERDAEQVFTSYAGGMSGRIALARVGIKDETTFNRMLRDNIKEAQEIGGLKAVQRAKKENLVAQTLFNAILNRRMPLAADPTSTYARAARLLQDYNFLRLMNQVGFTQLGEIGNAISIGGFRGILQQIPEMRRMLKRAKNGELDDPTLRAIEAATGVGTDRRVNQAMNRADTIDVFSEGRGDWIDKALFMLAPAKRITADISGMAPITLALERLSIRTAAQVLTDVAFQSRKLSQKRLAGLGLSKEMSDRVFSQIRSHALTKKSALFRNKKLRDINTDAWDDAEARDAFMLALARWTRRSIQQNDVGNLNIYMTSTMGQVVSQFRTFMLVSWSKQFLHNVKAKDVRTLYTFLFSTTFASIPYIAQTQVNAQFRDDKEKYLNEMLDPVTIAKASFQRSSWSSLFPALVDTGAMFYADDPVFAYRSSGLDTNLITGIPTFQLIFKGLASAQAMSRSTLNPDLQFSQGQQRALNTLIPWQNAIGIKNALNKLVELRPESTKVE